MPSDYSPLADHAAALAAVERHFGLAPADRIGGGHEGAVYAIDAERVVKVLPGRNGAFADRVAELYARLAAAGVGFRVPEVLDSGSLAALDGAAQRGVFVVQRRLPGRPLSERIAGTRGAERSHLLALYATGALAFAAVRGEPGRFGDAIEVAAPVAANRFVDYLLAKARAQRARVGDDALADRALEALPGHLVDFEPGAPVLCHGDYFPDNLMVADVGAPRLGDLGVIDLSTQACWGEPLFDAATAIAFLPLADGATRGDLAASLASLAPGGERESVERRLGPYAVWFALYYRFATNHPRLYDWTQVVLERAAQLLEGAEADRILRDA